MEKFSLDLIRISYILNNACNLFCKHCFQNASQRHNVSLSVEDAIKATKFAIKYNKSENKDIEITLIGGEPSLYSNFIELKKCFELLFKNNYTIKIFRIYTNGTVYSEDLMDLLDYISQKGYKEKIFFYITKDFLEEFPTRINANGKSMNTKIEETISKIKMKKYNIKLQYIFAKDDVKNYSKILYKAYYDNNIHIDYSYPCDPRFDLNYNDFNFMIDELYKFQNEYKVNSDFYKRVGMEMLSDFLLEVNIDKSIRNEIRCDPIKGEFSISPKGYIIPCVKLLEKENEFSDLNIDKVYKNPNLLFENKNILNIINYEDKNEEGKKCNECILKNYCHQCRLFPTLINLQQKEHIEHSKQQCNRIFTFCSCVLKKIKEYNNGWNKNFNN